MTVRNGLVTATLALSMAACAPASTMAGSDPRPKVPPTTVEVQNHNWQDMVVYVVQGTQRIRLGMVTSMRTETFRVPRTAIGASGQIRLLADPIGSPRGYLSETLNVRAGQRVALEVGHNIGISFVSIWN